MTNYRIHEIEPADTPGMGTASECVVTVDGVEVRREAPHAALQPGSTLGGYPKARPQFRSYHHHEGRRLG